MYNENYSLDFNAFKTRKKKKQTTVDLSVLYEGLSCEWLLECVGFFLGVILMSNQMDAHFMLRK